MKRNVKTVKTIKTLCQGLMICTFLGFSFQMKAQSPVAQEPVKLETAGSNTWTAPTGAFQITKIQAWGAGGGGGNATVAARIHSGGSGGGGGAYSENTTAIKLSSVRTLNYTVGAGGDAQSDGGASSASFNGSTKVNAGGGKAGSQLQGKEQSGWTYKENAVTAAGGQGGTASSGTTNTSGGDGGQVKVTCAGTAGTRGGVTYGKGGDAAGTGGGTGGAGGSWSYSLLNQFWSQKGNDGSPYGGGGSGAGSSCWNVGLSAKSVNGGVGAAGAVWITYNTLTLTVTFASNYTGGGTIGTTTLPYYNTYASMENKPADPTRANYRFGGWFMNSACTDTVNWNANCILESNFNIYAKWIPDPKITLDTISYTTNLICDGGEITFTANPILVAGDVTYQWTGNGLQSTTGVSVKAVPTTINTLTYTVVATAQVDDATVTATRSVNINVDGTEPSLVGTLPSDVSNINACYFEYAAGVDLYSNDDMKALFEDDYHDVVVTSVDDTVKNNKDWKITRTYTVKDECGHEYLPSLIMVASGKDATAPFLNDTWTDSIVGFDTIYNYANHAQKLLTDDEVKDLFEDCSDVVVSHIDNEVSTNHCDWKIVRTYTIKDTCDNAITKTMYVRGGDVSAPALVGTWPENITNQITCLYLADASELKDNDYIKSLYKDLIPFSVTSENDTTGNDKAWTIRRTYTIMDTCGNVVTPLPTMSVSGGDTIRPTYTCPANDTVFRTDYCDYDVNPKETGLITNVWDNCSEKFDTTFFDVEITPVDAVEGFTQFRRTWRLKDNAGNMSHSDSIQIITVLDTTRPTYVRPRDIALFKDDTCGYDISPKVAGMISDVWDNCSTILDTTYYDEDVTRQYETREGHTVIKRTWRLVDNAGNISLSDSVQYIIIRDTINPTFTAPADTTVYTDANCEFDISVAATGDVTDEADNCTSVLEAVYTDEDVTPADTCKGIRIIKRTWSLTDQCFNETKHVQMITVADTSAPTFMVPADLVVCRNADRNIAADSSVTGVPTNIYENCSNATISFVDVDTTGTDNEYRVIVREWRAIDDCGNISVDTQRITIAPAISEDNFHFICSNDTTIVLKYGETEREIFFDTVQYTCDIDNVNVTLTSNAPKSNMYTKGVYDYTWTATDSCGFTVSCTFQVNIEFSECGTLTEPKLVKDIDGNEYNTIQVGSDCWFAENLRAQHYSDSTEIPTALTYVSKMNDNETENLNLYGRLYDWKSGTRLSATDTVSENIQGACPKGWRLPTVMDFQNLIKATENINDAKSTDCWISNAGTNVLGTNLRPGGRYNSMANFFEEMGGKLYLMLADVTYSATNPVMLNVLLSCNCPSTLFIDGSKENAISIRCIAADENAFESVTTASPIIEKPIHEAK